MPPTAPNGSNSSTCKLLFVSAAINLYELTAVTITNFELLYLMELVYSQDINTRIPWSFASTIYHYHTFL